MKHFKHERFTAVATALSLSLGLAACSNPEPNSASIEVEADIDGDGDQDTIIINNDNELAAGEEVLDAPNEEEAPTYEEYFEEQDLQGAIWTWEDTWSRIRGQTAEGPNFNLFMDNLIENAQNRIASNEELSGSNAILLIGNDKNEEVTVVDNFAYYGWSFGETEGENIVYAPIVSDQSQYEFLTAVYRSKSGELEAISVGELGSTLPSDHSSFLLGAFVPESNGSVRFTGEPTSTTYEGFDEAFEAAAGQAYMENLVPIQDPRVLKERI